MDVYECNVLGWSISSDLSAEQITIIACFMAICNRIKPQDLIFILDREIHHMLEALAKILESKKIIIRSMSGKGNFFDNSVVENLRTKLKVDWIHSKIFIYHEQDQLNSRSLFPGQVQ